MADAYGRLTGRAGVCLGTLGPGATNLVTAVADAFLDRAPLVALTGQSDLERMHKESHQYIDLLGIMRPVVKWNARVSSPEIVPEVVRKAFKVAESEKPGVDPPGAARGRDDAPAGRLAAPPPRARPARAGHASELQRAAELIDGRREPDRLAGNGAIRAHASRALRAFVHTTGIPVAETFMAKGLLDYEDPQALGTVGLQARDYEMAGFEDADVVIADRLRPRRARARALEPARRQADHGDRQRRRRDRRVLHPRGRADRRHRPRAGAAGRRLQPRARLGRPAGLEPAARAGVRRAAATPATTTSSRCARLACCRTSARRCGRSDMLVSDVGLHKLWIGRMFPAHEPGTVLIANGLAGMGFALPTAIAAKLVDPDRKVVTVSRRRGLPHELPGARDRRAPARRRWSTSSGRTASTARSCGSRTRSSAAISAWTSATRTSSSSPRRSACPAWRCASAGEFSHRLSHALTLDVPSVIVVPIDYSVDVAISRELGAETVAT